MNVYIVTASGSFAQGAVLVAANSPKAALAIVQTIKYGQEWVSYDSAVAANVELIEGLTYKTKVAQAIRLIEGAAGNLTVVSLLPRKGL